MTSAQDDAGPYPRRRVRVAALVHGVAGRGSGVRRLILDQARAWATADDVEVGLFVRCEAGTDDAWRDEPTVVAVRSSRLGIIGRFLARELLSAELARWRPDVIYLRHSTISPSVIVLAMLIPTVVGGDLDDLDELRIRSLPRYWYARLSRNLLLRRARRIIVVTHELARHPSITRYGRPISVVPNTIDLSAYPELPAPDNPAPRLVFIGAPRLAWSGVDKIARLAGLLPDWQFDVIGPATDEFPNVPPNLTVHGPLDRSDYLPVMARADAAIGPLALHRKGLSEASALKVAEYLAYGIPVIVASAEAAFRDGAPFLLRIPNTEDNVELSVDQIREFVLAWKGRRVERTSIGPIDVAVVEPARLRLIVEATRSQATRA